MFGLPWRRMSLWDCTVAGVARVRDRIRDVNMYLSSTATTRLNTRPAPLSQVSVTG
jgi:hypothetical protein